MLAPVPRPRGRRAAGRRVRHARGRAGPLGRALRPGDAVPRQDAHPDPGRIPPRGGPRPGRSARRRKLEERVAQARASATATGTCARPRSASPNPLTIFDCLDFSARFRCSDVASDVAFLAMDLRLRMRPDLAEAFVQRYVARSRDPALRRLLPFYVCYRACVRGKVESLRAEEPEISPADREEAARMAPTRVRRGLRCGERGPAPAAAGRLRALGERQVDAGERARSPARVGGALLRRGAEGLHGLRPEESAARPSTPGSTRPRRPGGRTSGSRPMPARRSTRASASSSTQRRRPRGSARFSPRPRGRTVASSFWRRSGRRTTSSALGLEARSRESLARCPTPAGTSTSPRRPAGSQ